MKNFPNISKSLNLYEKARKLIPCGTQMLAKGVEQNTYGVSPIYIVEGKGCKVTDIDGNRYVDMTMGMGPISLGYCFDAVDEAIKEQLGKGINWSLIDPLEYDVAELFVEHIPCAEMVRFAKTGAEATSATIRLARAFTGREKVVCCGYHGWHDWYISKTNRNSGIPKGVNQNIVKINYNDFEAVESVVSSDTACLIIEPVVFESPQQGYLEYLREITEKFGVILIFDEIWTGFRISDGGAQKYFNVTPDLSIFSKGCANGMPISVICGSRKVMSYMETPNFFFFSTFGGEMLSLAATKATIKFMIENNTINIICLKNKSLMSAFNKICNDYGVNFMKCIGLDYRSMIIFDSDQCDELEYKTFFQQEMVRRGIIWNGFHQCSYSHGDDDLEIIKSAYSEIILQMRNLHKNKNLKDKIEGQLLKPVFRNLGLGKH
jgi:glutamate-1-semialdehyde aminotransferase